MATWNDASAFAWDELGTWDNPIPVTEGTASATLGFAATGHGVQDVEGTAAGDLGFTTTAQGQREVEGLAGASLGGLTSTALGEPTTLGVAASAVAFSAAAQAVVAPMVRGTAVAAPSFSATGSGRTFEIVTGTGATLLAFTSAAVAEGEVEGPSTAVLGFIATAVGQREVPAEAATPLGFSADAAAVVGDLQLGTAAAALAFTGTAAGQRLTFGTGAGPLSFAGTASGAVLGQNTGEAAASITFSATVAGTVSPQIFGTATASLGFSTTGHGGQEGAGSAGLGFAATVTGLRTVLGLAAASLAFDAYSLIDEEVAENPTIVRPKTFSASLVARVPASSGPPTLTEVDRLAFSGMSYTDELNRPGSAVLGVPVRSLSSAAKDRLAALDLFPSEVWIYWGTNIVWAGEIQTLQIQGQTLNINCVGLLGYTFRMGVIADTTYSDVDQYAIAKGLIDDFQDLSYGNYGVDTSAVGTSGVTRDRTYLRDELHNVGTRLQDLTAISDGFDIRVDPATRELVLSDEQGSDLSNTVFIDERNVDAASVVVSVAPDDLANFGSFTGTSTTETGSTKTFTTKLGVGTSGRDDYGRSWIGENFQNVTVEETVDEHAEAYLRARSIAYFQPGATIVPRPGADVGDFGAGDRVAYSYDAGLGRQSGNLRIAKMTVNVDENSTTRISVEFA